MSLCKKWIKIFVQGDKAACAMDVRIDTYETKVGPRNGAQVVARAWSDSEFKLWLVDDATAQGGLATCLSQSARFLSPT